MESMDSYLDTVSGYVYDNDKIVTYKWLSKEVEIHVNVAKQVLSHFWDKYKKQGDIECTFLIMGTLKDGGMRVEVVKEKTLADAKHKFNQILSEHIYSVQKALPDLELLAISGEGDVKYSAIKCHDSVERTNDESSTLRWGQVRNDIPKTIPKEVPSESERRKQETEVSVETEKSEVPPKQSKTSDKKGTNNKKSTITVKGGFHNLFGKVVNQPKSSPESSPSVDKKESPKKDTNSKTTEVKELSEKKNSSSTNQNGRYNESKEITVIDEKKINKREIIDTKCQENPKTSVKEEIKNKKPNRGTKRNRNKESAKASSKKRKRIIEKNDSSDSEVSSDINIEDDEMMELPPSPKDIPEVVKKAPSPEKVKIENGKRKVLKVVDQTYEEDGFLVSKKVHVYESCSEDETETVPNNPPPKAPPKNPEPRKKESKSKKNTSDSKQTTLMSFFKKS